MSRDGNFIKVWSIVVLLRAPSDNLRIINIYGKYVNTQSSPIYRHGTRIICIIKIDRPTWNK